jgi:hypothetical protein
LGFQNIIFGRAVTRSDDPQVGDEWASHISGDHGGDNPWNEEDANITGEWRDDEADPEGPVRAFCMVSYGRTSTCAPPPAAAVEDDDWVSETVAAEAAAPPSALELTEENLKVTTPHPFIELHPPAY